MTLQGLYDTIRSRALSYPDTCEEAPWGERVLKVANKIFVFHGITPEHLRFGVRLPHSGFTVLASPFAEPTGYGLARSGWVTMTFTSPRQVTQAQLFEWIDESYRAVAPARLVKALPPVGPPPAVQGTPAPPPPITSRLALSSDDALRAERSVAGFRQRGVEVILLGGPSPEALAAVKKAMPSRLVVDLGRRAPAGIELAKASCEMFPRLKVIFAGVRDATMQRKVDSEMPDAETSRFPPGDPRFIVAAAPR